MNFMWVMEIVCLLSDNSYKPPKLAELSEVIAENYFQFLEKNRLLKRKFLKKELIIKKKNKKKNIVEMYVGDKKKINYQS